MTGCYKIRLTRRGPREIVGRIELGTTSRMLCISWRCPIHTQAIEKSSAADGSPSPYAKNLDTRLRCAP